MIKMYAVFHRVKTENNSFSDIKINDLKLLRRTKNALLNAEITNISELLMIHPGNLLMLRGFGKGGMKDLKLILSKKFPQLDFERSNDFTNVTLNTNWRGQLCDSMNDVNNRKEEIMSLYEDKLVDIEFKVFVEIT